jgi:spore coat protein A, manganese oxidase
MVDLKLRRFGFAIFLAMILLALPVSAEGSETDAPTLNASGIPKFETELTGPPPVFVPDSTGDADSYTITMTESTQSILPTPFPRTTVWAYAGNAMDLVSGEEQYLSASPSASFEAVRGMPIRVEWNNSIENHLFPVDPTLHRADPNDMGMLYCEDGVRDGEEMMGTPISCTQPYPPGYTFAQQPVPLVTHLHGGEVRSTSDGNPDAWWTADGVHGKAYSTEEPTTQNAAVFSYPNEQQPATLWYHDHALGITRLNVMSGLAGFYLLRDPSDPTEQALNASGLVRSKYEVPLVFQDREFNEDGSFWFPEGGNSPPDHPYWNPEFFGEVIMVNGKAWPKMCVDQGVYRFRLLDGSNARFYTLSFSNGMNFTQIGSDGGYLQAPAELGEVTISPGERADILVDFSGIAPGTEIILKNSAGTPFGNPEPDPVTNNTGVIMKFIVTESEGPAFPDLPDPLNPTLTGGWPTLPEANTTRTLVLQEVINTTADEPTMLLINGQEWGAPVSESPAAGTTEEWIVVNPTADTHPIHLHLVQFQLVERIPMDTEAYQNAWYELNGDMMPPYEEVPDVLPIGDFVTGEPEHPADNEKGWKDTVQMPPEYATVIRVRFAEQDGGPYPFDPSEGPGYVWHCHILDHEDNEMMRPYVVTY